VPTVGDNADADSDGHAADGVSQRLAERDREPDGHADTHRAPECRPGGCTIIERRLGARRRLASLPFDRPWRFVGGTLAATGRAQSHDLLR
jgi:hypothetical protein